MSRTMDAPPARLDWCRIETLILDMDGTLLDLHFDNLVWNECLPERVAERRGESADVVRDAVRATLDAERGHLRYYCFEHWTRVFGLSMASVEAELEHRIATRSGAREFVNAARERVKTMILATNAHPQSLERKLRVTGVGDAFDHLVSSHVIGFPKEDPRYWPGLAGCYDIEPARAALIDDNIAVLEAARAFGIAQVLGVARPDSRGAVLSPPGFSAVEAFSQLLA